MHCPVSKAFSWKPVSVNAEAQENCILELKTRNMSYNFKSHINDFLLTFSLSCLTIESGGIIQ